jgi:hypothetical protein
VLVHAHSCVGSCWCSDGSRACCAPPLLGKHLPFAGPRVLVCAQNSPQILSLTEEGMLFSALQERISAGVLGAEALSSSGSGGTTQGILAVGCLLGHVFTSRPATPA